MPTNCPKSRYPRQRLPPVDGCGTCRSHVVLFDLRKCKKRINGKSYRSYSVGEAKAPDLLVDGELQGDAALIPSVAKSKAPAAT